MKTKSHCEVCRKRFLLKDLYPIELLSEALSVKIKEDVKNPDMHGYICLSDLGGFQLARSRELLQLEVGEIDQYEQQVLDTISDKHLLAENINEEYEESLSFGQRTADRISSFGGSWNFICIFFSLLVLWMILNSWILVHEAYDPYPYILLNLILSCLAAIQAPIIMMSQNRQAHKDRLTAENDYKVNLKTEILTQQLTAKFDELMKKQWMRMLDQQQMQIEISQTVLNIQKKLEQDESLTKKIISRQIKVEKEIEGK